MQGLLANLPGYQAQPGPPQGFPGMPTDMSGQSRAPMQIAPQEQPQQTPEVMPQQMPQAPQPGFMERLGAGLGANSNTMLAMGASLLGGQGFGGAAQAAMGGRELDQKQASANQTEAALVKYGLSPDLAKVVAGNPALMSAVMQNRMGLGKGNQTADLQEYQYAKQHDGFKGSFQEWIANKRAGGGELGLNMVYGLNDKNEIVAFQPKKSGGLAEAQLPPGVKLLPSNAQFKDLGTEIGIFDGRRGQMIGTVPKDVAGAERQKVEGKGLGEASDSLASISSKMPGLETVIKRLDDLSEKATYTTAGRTLDTARREFGSEPRESAIARAEYVSVVDNQILPLLRDTFGAQFTQKEGETLRETLGDPNKAPKEKQAVLKAFIEQKRRDVQALRSRVGQPAGGSDGWKIERMP
jgi:hypothetical protein